MEPYEPVSVDDGSTAQRNLCVERITLLRLSGPEATCMNRPPLVALGARAALPWAPADEMIRPVSPALRTQGRGTVTPGDEKTMTGCTHGTGRGLCRASAGGLVERWQTPRRALDEKGMVGPGERAPWR